MLVTKRKEINPGGGMVAGGETTAIEMDGDTPWKNSKKTFTK